MDTDRQGGEPLENLPPEHPKKTDGQSGDQHVEENSSNPLSKKIDRLIEDIEEVKGNTKSEKNIDALDRIEKGIQKLADFMDKIVPGAVAPEAEHHDATPKTPEIEVPGALKFIHVRKPGGRVVKRQVKEQVVKK